MTKPFVKVFDDNDRQRRQAGMKKLIAAAALAALCGCTNHWVIELNNGDAYAYRTWAWQSKQEKRCADLEARARYYGRCARTRYATNVCHRIEVVMYGPGADNSQTNVLKTARYWIWGERQ